MTELAEEPSDEWSVSTARGPRRTSPPSPVTAAVVALAGYEVVALTLNSFLDADVLPSLTAWLRRPWLPTVSRTVARSGRWVLVSGTIASGVVLVTVTQRRAGRRRRLSGRRPEAGPTRARPHP
jgi:hypothetical protein